MTTHHNLTIITGREPGFFHDQEHDMTNQIELTEEEKAAILKDFEDWTGGCVPSECDREQIETYIHHYAPTEEHEPAYWRLLLPQS